MKFLELVKPTKQEEKELKLIVNKFLKKLNSDAIVGGSVAKGTWLKNNNEIDIYLRYNKDSKEDISKLTEKLLKKKFQSVKKIHGSRDYFHVIFQEKLFEIVPILKVRTKKHAKNITDLSPFHINWVKKNTNKNDARLAKAFCKANNCYGAESHIKGFSGYVLEILIAKYKTFNNLLKQSQKWRKKQVINLSKKDYSLSYSKKQSPLIIIDPTDNNRNAAAGLSDEKFEIFRKKAKEYLKKPSRKFFIKKAFDLNKIKVKKSEKIIILKSIPLEGKRDIIGCKILKIKKILSRKLKEKNFEFDSNWAMDSEAFIWFIFDKKPLLKTKVILGPFLKDEKNVKNFKKKHKNTFNKNQRINAKIQRKYLLPDKLIEKIIKSKEIKDLAKETKIYKL